GERTRSLQPTSRRFNAQLVAEPEAIALALQKFGWEAEPSSDWRWIIQALNPEPNPSTLPLLGRAYLGRNESLLLRKQMPDGGPVLSLRLWDSGVRLLPA